MSDLSLAERVELNPWAAQVAFDRVEGAANILLPGTDYHPTRYLDGNEIGLAAVIARDGVEEDFYNPFTPAVLTRVSFYADNSNDRRSAAWAPAETDALDLGGPLPPGLPRFMVFALAKINGLLDTGAKSSFRIDVKGVKPGRFTNAGGLRVPAKSLLAVSGAFQREDHILGRYLAREIDLEMDPEVDTSEANRTADDVAEEMEPVFDIVKGWADDSDVEESRKDFYVYMVAVDELLTERLSQKAA